MRKIISLICLLLPILASADSLEIRENAPDRHVVVKGDTLWDISATFFKSPWKWQQIWGLNKDTIKNPHWIYPGDVILLDRSNGTLHVGSNSAPANVQATQQSAGNVVKLSPHARLVVSEHNAVPVIPFKAIAPFLSSPLVAENADLASLPTLEGSYENRELLGANDVAYVRNLPADKGLQWQVFRFGKALIDPDTQEVLGNEIKYLGDATVEKFGQLSQLKITKSVLEIAKGDHFRLPDSAVATNFQPHAPSVVVNAKVISIYGGEGQTGQNGIITLNKGARDGLENGHVLALYQKGALLNPKKSKAEQEHLPDVRYGLVVVFRTFEKVSYALVLQSRLPVVLLDAAVTP